MSATINGPVVVTGGAAGIGRAAALACAERGAAVAILDLDEAAADEAAAGARESGAPDAIGLGCDVRDEDSVAAAIRAASERLGPPRGLVACAGIFRGGLVHEIPTETWREVIDTNLNGTFHACKHALARMVEHGAGGSVVCASSPFAEVCAPGGASAYSASKGAISSLVRSLALDYAPHSIRVNAIVPGATETALMWAGVPEVDVPAARERTSEQLALGRLAEPAEIAAGIAWLLSDQASYMTGSHLVIDGGLLARASIDE